MTDEQQEARDYLARHVAASVQLALQTHANPVLVLHEAPTVLTGLAGSFHLQLVRSQVLGDGDAQQQLDTMVADLRAHADPVANAPTGEEVPKSVGRRMREWIARAVGRV
jgi:hypothetical protein